MVLVCEEVERFLADAEETIAPRSTAAPTTARSSLPRVHV